jgi:hypothetical protein
VSRRYPALAVVVEWQDADGHHYHRFVDLVGR